MKSFFRVEKLDNWFDNFCILESWITVKLDIWCCKKNCKNMEYEFFYYKVLPDKRKLYRLRAIRSVS